MGATFRCRCIINPVSWLPQFPGLLPFAFNGHKQWTAVSQAFSDTFFFYYCCFENNCASQILPGSPKSPSVLWKCLKSRNYCLIPKPVGHGHTSWQYEDSRAGTPGRHRITHSPSCSMWQENNFFFGFSWVCTHTLETEKYKELSGAVLLQTINVQMCDVSVPKQPFSADFGAA